jgi:hypothetical protein
MRSESWLKIERIVGETAIREAVEQWRRFVIEQWRVEPLVMTNATVQPHPIYPSYAVEFRGGWVGTLRYIDHSARVIPWGGNLLSFTDGDPTAPKPVLGIEPNYGPNTVKLRAILRLSAELPLVYDPTTLLFTLLIYRAGLQLDRPVSAAEVVERSESYIQPVDDQWIRFGDYFPTDLLSLARERV